MRRYESEIQSKWQCSVYTAKIKVNTLMSANEQVILFTSVMKPSIHDRLLSCSHARDSVVRVRT